MKPLSFTMGYEIKTSAGPVLKPIYFSVWDQDSKFADFTPHAPLKFMNDSLVGLQYKKLLGQKHVPAPRFNFVTQATTALCPYETLFYNCADRLIKVQKKQTPDYNQPVSEFEKSWLLFWESHVTPSGINFKNVAKAIEIISNFENSIKQPLMYNFNLQLPKKLNDQLLSVYSFLFHLRSLIALDHNTHVDDTAFEAITCDSISDYLPRADFTTNDALLYWQFKKLSTPFIGHKDKDIRIEKLFTEPMQRAFEQYNHNACALIEQLPQDFITKHSNADLEQELYQIQMDWLLGSSAGLLFRIREELYGVLHGYEKIFWTQASNQRIKKANSLKVCFEIDENDLGLNKAA